MQRPGTPSSLHKRGSDWLTIFSNSSQIIFFFFLNIFVNVDLEIYIFFFYFLFFKFFFFKFFFKDFLISKQKKIRLKFFCGPCKRS